MSHETAAKTVKRGEDRIRKDVLRSSLSLPEQFICEINATFATANIITRTISHFYRYVSSPHQSPSKLARRSSRFHHDTRGGKPYQSHGFWRELETICSPLLSYAFPHAALLLCQRLPVIQGMPGVEPPRVLLPAVEEDARTDYSHRILLLTVLSSHVQRLPLHGQRLYDEQL